VTRLEQLAPQHHEPALGSHLVTRRRGYLHHGVYVGDGRVVHYSGLANGLHRGPVEEVPMDRFTRGQPVWVKSHATSNFDAREVIERARSRVGEDGYRLLTNNCEHFCEWCLRGEHRSYQVDALLARLRVLHATVRFVLSIPRRAMKPQRSPRARAWFTMRGSFP
jgi:Lecithin retinol acyltransferase